MKKILAVMLTSMFFLIGCVSIHSNTVSSSGEIIKKTYSQKGFSKIILSNAISLKLSQGNRYSIEVKLDKNYADYLNIEVKDNTLYAYLERGNTYNNADIKIDMMVPEIENIELNGASDVYMDEFNLSEIKIKLSGASNFDGEIEADRISIVESGTSSLELKGRADKIQIDLSGASDGYLKNLITKEAVFSVSGASDLELNVKNKIRGSVSGASALKVYGNPQIKSYETSGASDIIFK